LKENRAEIASQIAKEFLGKAETIDDFKVIIELVNKSGEFLIEIGNILGESEEKVVAVMHSKLEPRLVVTANRSAIGGGANAGKLASSITKIIGGGGGGKPYLGQGGGGDIEKFRESFNEIRKAIITHLS
jgi:alanyl-tRNA synthetase